MTCGPRLHSFQISCGPWASAIAASSSPEVSAKGSGKGGSSQSKDGIADGGSGAAGNRVEESWPTVCSQVIFKLSH